MKLSVENKIYGDYKRILKISNQQPCYNDEEIKSLIKYYTHFHVAKILFAIFICLVVTFILDIYCFSLKNTKVDEVFFYSGISSFAIVMLIVSILNKYDVIPDLRCFFNSDTDISNPENIRYELFYNKWDFMAAVVAYVAISVFSFLWLTDILFKYYKSIFNFIELLTECNNFILIVFNMLLIGIVTFIFIYYFYKRKIHNISNKS